MPAARAAPRAMKRPRVTTWRQRIRRFLLGLAVLSAASIVMTVVSINFAVGFFGATPINVLSPWFLDEKWHALKRYAVHRGGCIFRDGHDDMPRIVEEVARARHVDPLLLAALVETESSNRAHRISVTGAMGPAQLMPATAALLHVEDPFDPRQGIDGGARYLHMMLERFHGRVDLALAAYNTGPGNVVDGRVPAVRDVEEYVRRVTQRWRELKAGRP